jgi:hypothetical protein
MAELRQVIELHIEEEEELLFPRIELTMAAAELRLIAQRMMTLYHSKVEAGYRREPPRAHASAPHGYRFGSHGH